MNKLLSVIISCMMFSLPVSAMETDFLVDELLKNEKIEKPVVNTDYNYESVEKTTVKLRIAGNKLTTKKCYIEEGREIDLVVKQNVKFKNKVVIKEGTRATARIAAIMTKGMNGIPATIILDNIEIDGVDKNKIQSTFTKKGINLSLLVFPIKWALTPLPPTGSLTNFILGGEATIDKNTVVFVDYYPNWGNNQFLY